MSARICGVSSAGCKKLFNCPIHATGFSQWLMTNFLSAEFIRRLGSPFAAVLIEVGVYENKAC
jgi:hypothetical protein